MPGKTAQSGPVPRNVLSTVSATRPTAVNVSMDGLAPHVMSPLVRRDVLGTVCVKITPALAPSAGRTLIVRVLAAQPFASTGNVWAMFVSVNLVGWVADAPPLRAKPIAKSLKFLQMAPWRAT